MRVTCGKCGEDAPLEAWTERPITGRLPAGQFQCPKCGFAFQRREVEPGRLVVAENGAVMRMPGRVALVPCESVM